MTPKNKKLSCTSLVYFISSEKRSDVSPVCRYLQLRVVEASYKAATCCARGEPPREQSIYIASAKNTVRELNIWVKIIVYHVLLQKVTLSQFSSFFRAAQTQLEKNANKPKYRNQVQKDPPSSLPKRDLAAKYFGEHLEKDLASLLKF